MKKRDLIYSVRIFWYKGKHVLPRVSPFFLFSQVNLGEKTEKKNRKKPEKTGFTVSGSFSIKGNTCSQEFLLSSFFPKSSSNEKTASYQTLESSLQKLAAAATKIIFKKVL